MNEAVVGWLNGLSASAARQQFHKCCGAWWWCDQMVEARPMVDAVAVHMASNHAFDAMPRDAWLEAFGSHPKLGDLDSLRMRLAGNKQWSANEQSGVTASDEATLQELADGNRQYEQRFGYVFILCATGLSAAEMLTQMQQRLHNNDATELAKASAEQRKITSLRLDKLTCANQID
jgi:2-oxo-4-hydroxy-4-carboxy-5-ureidoimidazoline decarboxylase